MATTRLGKYAEARANLKAGLEVSRAARHGGAESNCLFTLADLAIDLGDNDEARVWAEASLARATEIGQARQIAAARGFLGVVSMRQGDFHGAAAWFEASLATWRELGEVMWIAEALGRFAQLAIEQADVSTARTRLKESLLLAQELGDRLRIATVLEGFVQIAVLEGTSRLALKLAVAAESMRDSIGVPLPPAERSRLDRYLAQARSTLGKRAADTAQIEGRALGVQGAIELALGNPSAHPVDPAARRVRGVLTAREKAVARLVAQGLTNRQIAEQLVIAEGTAERHVGNIFGKLNMNARSQIAAWAVGQGLVKSEIPGDM
jgi:non-specific serine/threonine protein kinase